MIPNNDFKFNQRQVTSVGFEIDGIDLEARELLDLLKPVPNEGKAAVPRGDDS